MGDINKGLFNQGEVVDQGEDLPVVHPLEETKVKESGKDGVCFIASLLRKSQGI